MVVQSPRKRYQYEKARQLRRRGLSYSEIKMRLKTSKSSISLWCRDIILGEKQKKRLLVRAHNMIMGKLGSKANHDKREKEIFEIRKMAKEEIKKLGLESLKIAGTILYWAEGNKNKSAAVSNSDPRMIELFLIWLKKIFDISPNRLKAHLHIHYGNDDKKIKRYWSRLTGIPLKNFGKSFIKPRGTGHRTNILPNGIIKVRVSGIGTENLRHRILAWTEKIYELSKIYPP